MTETTTVVVDDHAEIEAEQAAEIEAARADAAEDAAELAHEIAEHATADAEDERDTGLMLGRLITIAEDLQRRLGLIEVRTDDVDFKADIALEAAGDAIEAAANAEAASIEIDEIDITPEPEEAPERTHWWWR